MIGIGLRAQKGGAVVLCLRLDREEPRLLLSTLLDIAPQPYRDAAGLAHEDAVIAVAEGRRRQDELAAEGLKAILDPFREGAVAGLLVNRAGWITDLLGYSREWAEHIPVAENLGLRDALRAACRELGIAILEVDEKSLPDIEPRLAALGAGVTPWRKEQKLACMAAAQALSMASRSSSALDLISPSRSS